MFSNLLKKKQKTIEYDLSNNAVNHIDFPTPFTLPKFLFDKDETIPLMDSLDAIFDNAVKLSNGILTEDGHINHLVYNTPFLVNKNNETLICLFRIENNERNATYAFFDTSGNLVYEMRSSVHSLYQFTLDMLDLCDIVLTYIGIQGYTINHLRYQKFYNSINATLNYEYNNDSVFNLLCDFVQEDDTIKDYITVYENPLSYTLDRKARAGRINHTLFNSLHAESRRITLQRYLDDEVWIEDFLDDTDEITNLIKNQILSHYLLNNDDKTDSSKTKKLEMIYDYFSGDEDEDLEEFDMSFTSKSFNTLDLDSIIGIEEDKNIFRLPKRVSVGYSGKTVMIKQDLSVLLERGKNYSKESVIRRERKAILVNPKVKLGDTGLSNTLLSVYDIDSYDGHYSIELFDLDGERVRTIQGTTVKKLYKQFTKKVTVVSDISEITGYTLKEI